MLKHSTLCSILVKIWKSLKSLVNSSLEEKVAKNRSRHASTGILEHSKPVIIEFISLHIDTVIPLKATKT